MSISTGSAIQEMMRPFGSKLYTAQCTSSLSKIQCFL